MFIKKAVVPVFSLIGLLCICSNISAKDISGCSFKLIPTPQKVEVLDGCFKIKSDTPVVLANPQDSNDSFAAEQLIEEIKKGLSIELKVTIPEHFLCYKNPKILIGQISRDKPILRDLKDLKVKLPDKLNSQGYVLSITPNQILVAGKSPAGVFYGIQTLKQIIRTNTQNTNIPGCIILDWPAMTWRGWTDDISRGPIPTMEFMKREIRTLSEYKLNMFTMYTEHVFKLKKHPKLAPSDGITAEQMRQLSEYAKRYHVEVVGNFQSFGHANNILKHPEYAHLGETPHLFTPAKQQTYDFLADVYSEIAPAYQSRYFLACCDETEGLGVGPSGKMMDKIGFDGVYSYHINRLDELLKPYGKTLMIWGDMLLRHPDAIQKIPEDSIILTWAYGTRKNFDEWIVPFVKTNRTFMVCPGTSCWGQIWPDLDNAVANIAGFVRDGARYNALGMLNTTWVDGGENFFSYNWYPLIWGAECAWRPPVLEDCQNFDDIQKKRLNLFGQAYAPLFYGCPDISIVDAMLRLSKLRRISLFGRWSARAFWKDSLETVVSSKLADNQLAQAQELLAAAQSVIDTFNDANSSVLYNKDALEYSSFAARRVRLVARKGLVAVEINKRLKGYSKPGDCEIGKTLSEICREVEVLRKEYIRLWNLENRPYAIERVLERFDRLTEQLKNKKYKIVIEADKDIFIDSAVVKMASAADTGQIHYTLNGTVPNLQSKLYSKPFELTEISAIKAALFVDGKIQPGSVTSTTVTKVTPRVPENPQDLINGLTYRYFEGRWDKLPDFSSLEPVKTGNTDHFDITLRDRDDSFGFVFEGFIDIKEEGIYTFYTRSDDGSKLYIGDEEVVNNDSLHGPRERSGQLAMAKGKHKITVLFFEWSGSESLTVSYKIPMRKKRSIPASVLYRER